MRPTSAGVAGVAFVSVGRIATCDCEAEKSFDYYAYVLSSLARSAVTRSAEIGKNIPVQRPTDRPASTIRGYRRENWLNFYVACS